MKAPSAFLVVGLLCFSLGALASEPAPEVDADAVRDEALPQDDLSSPRFQRLCTFDGPLDEGPFHQGPAVRVRGLARASGQAEPAVIGCAQALASPAWT
jgi:hypothetical protein